MASSSVPEYCRRGDDDLCACEKCRNPILDIQKIEDFLTPEGLEALERVIREPYWKRKDTFYSLNEAIKIVTDPRYQKKDENPPCKYMQHLVPTADIEVSPENFPELHHRDGTLAESKTSLEFRCQLESWGKLGSPFSGSYRAMTPKEAAELVRMGMLKYYADLAASMDHCKLMVFEPSLSTGASIYAAHVAKLKRYMGVMFDRVLAATITNPCFLHEQGVKYKY